MRFGLAVVLTCLLAGSAANAQISDDVVRIGVLNDQSNVYADLGGPGSVIAVRMAIEKEAQARVEPWTAEEFEVGEGRFKIKRRKHGERLVEFFDASTVVEKEQAVDVGPLASANQDMIGSPFGLKETMRGEKHRTRWNDTVVCDAVEDHIARRKHSIP